MRAEIREVILPAKAILSGLALILNGASFLVSQSKRG